MLAKFSSVVLLSDNVVITMVEVVGVDVVTVPVSPEMKPIKSG